MRNKFDSKSLPILFAAISSIFITACAEHEVEVFNEWPIACDHASFEVETTLMSQCARRTGDGTLEIHPDVLTTLPPGKDIQSLRVADQWFLVLNDKTVPTLTYDNGPDYFEEGLARTVHDGKIGFVNERLETVIEPLWDFAFPFENGVARVCTGCQQVPDGGHTVIVGGGWGYIDSAGTILVEPVHSRDDLPLPP